MSLRTSSWIAAGILFAAATVWINCEVKVNLQGNDQPGSTAELGEIKVGKPAPDFETKDLAGHSLKLSDFKGQKVVLMDFWATWCGPCKMAMPGLQSVLDDLKGRGLEVLSVNEGETAEQAGGFIARKAYGFHVVMDPDTAIGHSYGVTGIPTLVVVDKQGIVRRIRVGYSPDDSDLRETIEKYLGK